MHLGPQGIEPRSVVPETTVLSVELQARLSAPCNVPSKETCSARVGRCFRNWWRVLPGSLGNQGSIRG